MIFLKLVQAKGQHQTSFKVAARANRDVLVRPLRMGLGTYNFACVEYLYTESHRLKFDPLYTLFPYKELCSNMEKSTELSDFKLIFFFNVLNNQCFEAMDMIKIAKTWKMEKNPFLHVSK